MKHLILLIFAYSGLAESWSGLPEDLCTVSWTEPTTRTDGTPLNPSEIKWYEIYKDGVSMRIYQRDTRFTTYDTGHCYRVKTWDTANRKSILSTTEKCC